jgi:integrase
VAGLLLSSRSAEVAACALETALRAYRRDGRAPNDETRQLAVALATAVPLMAVRLPLLLAAAGPQAATAVKAEARRIAASGLDPDGAGSASSLTAALSASEAARLTGVSSQAILAAAAAGRLAARKDRITGAWLIDIVALDEWIGARTQLLQGWIKGLRLNSSSALTVIGYVSQVFTAAADEGVIARNPLSAKSVQKPAKAKTEAISWSLAEVEAVAAGLPAWLGAFAYLGAACGARQGELFALALGDLDFLRRTVHVEVQIKRVGGEHVFAPVKNKKTRDVPVAVRVRPGDPGPVRAYAPVPAGLGDAAVARPPRPEEARPAGDPRAGVHPADRSPASRARGVQPAVAGRMEGGRGSDRGPRLNGCHVLRYTAASAWLSAGLNPAKAAAFLGDTLEVTLATYSHFMPDDDGRARTIMDAFFDSGAASSAPDVPGAAH